MDNIWPTLILLLFLAAGVVIGITYAAWLPYWHLVLSHCACIVVGAFAGIAYVLAGNSL